jgi:hypothetical protein
VVFASDSPQVPIFAWMREEYHSPTIAHRLREFICRLHPKAKQG